MILEIDPRSPVPRKSSCASRSPRTCSRAAWRAAIASRRSQLANDLGLAGGTVARAYRELESDGVVTTHGRHGTVIEGPPRRPAPPADLNEAARSYADQASRTGASLEDALTAVRVAFASERTA